MARTKAKPPQGPVLKRYSKSVDDIAVLMGLSAPHIRTLARTNAIPFIKVGHVYWFDPTEVERALLSIGGVKTKPQDNTYDFDGV